jgi:hypothetical protein
MRGELLKQLATRVSFEVPQAMLEREIDRRVEEFVRRLIDQQIDPMKTNINWEDLPGAAEGRRGGSGARRPGAGRSGAAREHRRLGRGGRGEIARYASGRAVHRRRSARGSKKRGGIGRLVRGAAGASGRLTSCCSRATIVQT